MVAFLEEHSGTTWRVLYFICGVSVDAAVSVVNEGGITAAVVVRGLREGGVEEKKRTGRIRTDK